MDAHQAGCHDPQAGDAEHRAKPPRLRRSGVDRNGPAEDSEDKRPKPVPRWKRRKRQTTLRKRKTVGHSDIHSKRKWRAKERAQPQGNVSVLQCHNV